MTASVPLISNNGNTSGCIPFCCIDLQGQQGSLTRQERVHRLTHGYVRENTRICSMNAEIEIHQMCYSYVGESHSFTNNQLQTKREKWRETIRTFCNNCFSREICAILLWVLLLVLIVGKDIACMVVVSLKHGCNEDITTWVYFSSIPHFVFFVLIWACVLCGQRQVGWALLLILGIWGIVAMFLQPDVKFVSDVGCQSVGVAWIVIQSIESMLLCVGHVRTLDWIDGSPINRCLLSVSRDCQN
eukprot:199092_1